MFATRRLAAKVDRSTFKQALKSVNQHQPAPVNQPLRPAKPLLEQLTGEPAPKQSLSDRQAAAAKGKNKSIVDSFRSLPSNQRILVGVAFGAVAIAGLFWDRTMEEAELKQEEEYGFERVADEIAKRRADAANAPAARRS